MIWQVLSIATTMLVEEDTIKVCMLSVQNICSNTLLENCTVASALGMLILRALQTLMGQNSNGEPNRVTVCLWKNRSSLLCASMHLGLSTSQPISLTSKG